MAAGQPGTPFRSRSAYLGHLTVGSGDGTVLIERDVVSELRAVAARTSSGPDGGLLYGCTWHDDQGGYTVVDAFTQAGSAAGLDRGETISALRGQAALRYPGAAEVGWWRTAPRPASPEAAQDPGTWPLHIRPEGIGLVVYADGAPWEASGLSATAPEGTEPPAAGPAERAEPEPPARELPARELPARELPASQPAEPQPERVSPMRTMGPPALSPDPAQLWRPEKERRVRGSHRPWWTEPQRIVAALIVFLVIVVVIAVLIVLSPLF